MMTDTDRQALDLLAERASRHTGRSLRWEITPASGGGAMVFRLFDDRGSLGHLALMLLAPRSTLLVEVNMRARHYGLTPEDQLLIARALRA